MHRSTIVFLLILSMIAAALGYNYFTRPFSDYQAAQTEMVSPVANGELESELDSKLVLVPLSEKELAQLIAVPYSLDEKNIGTQSAVLDWIKQNQPGVVTLFGSNVSTRSAKLAINKINTDPNIESKPLIAVDHEGGSVQRLSGVGFTDLPSWESTCSLTSSERQNLLTASAREVSKVGVEIVFAPVIDVASQSAILKNRVCSSRPEIVGARATEFISIFAQEKIVSVIKHYPGIGSISKDLHRSFDEVILNLEGVLIFKNLLESHSLLGVMSAHVGVKDRYENEPCSLNKDCIDDITSHFSDTLIFTDALDMDSAGYVGQGEELISLAERAVLSIKAGNDVLVFGPNVSLDSLDKVSLALKKAYLGDEQFQQQAEKSVKKIRQYKESLRQ